MYKASFTVLGLRFQLDLHGENPRPCETVADIVQADDAVTATLQVMRNRANEAGGEFTFVCTLSGPVELAGSFENLPRSRHAVLARGDDVPFTVFGFDRQGGDVVHDIFRRPSWVRAVHDAYQKYDFGPDVDAYYFVAAIRGNVDLALRVEDLRDAFGGALPEVAAS